MTTFDELGLTQEILQAVKRLGFEKPTLVQEQSIPHIIEGKDVIAESATGSGKTLAFGSAIIHHAEPKKGIQALVLAPTRELAEQVKESMRSFSHHKPLKIITIYGGVAMGPQYEHLKVADIVVATPGRLLDHVRQGSIDLSKVKYLVLDEADRMLDMGFIEDVEKIMRECPKERQTLFFSATVAPRIRELAQKYMNNPVMVSATKMVDPTKLEQIYYNVQKNQKLSLLAHLLKKEESGLVMVFCNTRRTTDFVVSNLKNNGIKAIAIHGGLSQNKRSKTLDIFGNAKVGVLVCTDVAARGLHIDDVSHVYNYEIPNDPKEYVHRIGRTARAGSDGKVINLLSDIDHGNFYRVLDEFRDYNIDKVETPEFERLNARKVEDGDRRGGFRGGPRRGGFSGGRGHSGGRGRGPSRGSSRGGSRSGGNRSSGGGRQWGARPDKPARN